RPARRASRPSPPCVDGGPRGPRPGRPSHTSIVRTAFVDPQELHRDCDRSTGFRQRWHVWKTGFVLAAAGIARVWPHTHSGSDRSTGLPHLSQRYSLLLEMIAARLPHEGHFEIVGSGIGA